MTTKFNSKKYWSERYENGGNSGAGSYGRLSIYKAQVVNQIIEDYEVVEVIEFGSGDGNQCSLFNVERYTGVDASQLAIDKCNEQYHDRPHWKFYHISDEVIANINAPLVMSLDVIFHLVEEDVFEDYMKALFDSSTNMVLIYSSNENKNSGVPHVKHRKYTDWIEKNRPDYMLIEEMKNPYPYDSGADPNNTSFASFKLFGKKSP